MTTPTLDLPEMPPIETAPADPPKRGRGRPRKDPTDTAPREPRTTPAAARKSSAALEKRLAGQITSIGLMVAIAHADDGMVILSGADQLAASLAKLAEENPTVKKNLERTLSAGAWGGVLAAVLPMAVAIAANHGAVPKSVAAMLAPSGAEGAS